MRIQRNHSPIFRPSVGVLRPSPRFHSAKTSLSQELELFFNMASDPSLRVAILEILQGTRLPEEIHLRALAAEILALPRMAEPDYYSRKILIQLKAQKRKVVEIIVPNVLHEENDFINAEVFNFRLLTQNQAENPQAARLVCLKFNFLLLLALAKTVSSRALAMELCQEFEPLGESEAALLQTVELACRGFVSEISANPLFDFLGIFPALRGGFFRPQLPAQYGVFGYIRHLFRMGLWRLRRMVQ